MFLPSLVFIPNPGRNNFVFIFVPKILSHCTLTKIFLVTGLFSWTTEIFSLTEKLCWWDYPKMLLPCKVRLVSYQDTGPCRETIILRQPVQTATSVLWNRKYLDLVLIIILLEGSKKNFLFTLLNMFFYICGFKLIQLLNEMAIHTFLCFLEQ